MTPPQCKEESTSLNKKKILWNGTAWVNMDGINLDTPINEWTTIE